MMMPSRSTPNLQTSREANGKFYFDATRDDDSPPPAPPVRDSSSLRSVKYGPGHEKFPSWPVPSAAETPQALRVPPSGGSHRSKSWTDHTNYPKEKVVTYTRPYMKRQHSSHTQQKLKTVMERCEKIPPEMYESRYEGRLYLPHVDRDGKQLGDMDYMVPSPPERDTCKPQLTQADLEEYARSYQDPSVQEKPPHITESGLEDFIKYARNYEASLYPQKHEEMLLHLHQKQISYAQSEGYHSYVSSTDSTSTPFLDRLRRDSEATRHNSSWEEEPTRREGRDSVVTTSSGSASSSETLKWHGSMSDVSVASSSCTHLASNKQLIAHSARVQTPQRHHSESVLYMGSETQEGWKDRESRNNSNNKLKLFPVNTYTVQEQQSPTSTNSSNNRLSTNTLSVADRISELEKQQKYSYLDPDKKHKIPDPTLKAIQKKALLSFYERHQTSNKTNWRSEPQLAQNLQPVPPPQKYKAQAPSRRASSASDYASNTSKRNSVASNLEPTVKLAPRHQHSNSCGSLSTDLLGPVIVGPSISVDDWVPEKPPDRPPKNPYLRNAYPDLFNDQRVPSPDLPPPSPPTVLEDEVFQNDEPLPPPPTELENWQQNFQDRLGNKPEEIKQTIGLPHPRHYSSTRYPSGNRLTLNGSIAVSQKVSDQYRAEPLRAEPLRSEHLRSEQLRSEQLRSEQFRSEQFRSEQFRSEQFRSDQIRSDQLRSDQLRSEPLRSEPLRCEPLRCEPLRCEPIRSDQLRSDPLRSDQLRTDTSRSDQLKADTSRSEQLRSDTSRSDQLKSETSRADPSRSDQLRSDISRSDQLRSDTSRSDHLRSDALRSEQLRSDALRSDQLRSDALRSEQLRSDALRSDQLRSDASRFDQLRSDASRSDQLRSEVIRSDNSLRSEQVALRIPAVKEKDVTRNPQRSSIAEGTVRDVPPPLQPRQMRINQSMRARISENRPAGIALRMSPPKDDKLKDSRSIGYSMSQSKASYLASRRERERIVPDSDTGSYKRTISPNGHVLTSESFSEQRINSRETVWPLNKTPKETILKNNNNTNILRRASMIEKSLKIEEKEELKKPQLALPDVLPVSAKLITPRYSRPSHLSLAPIDDFGKKSPPSPPKSPFTPLRNTNLSPLNPEARISPENRFKPKSPETKTESPKNLRFTPEKSPSPRIESPKEKHPQILPSLSPNLKSSRRISPLSTTSTPLKTSPLSSPSLSPTSPICPTQIPQISPPESPRPKVIEGLQLMQRTEVVLRVNACTSDASSQTEKEPTPLPTRRKLQEEIDCEKLSEDFISQLPTADRLKDILVQGPDHKKPTDYVTGLFRLEATARPRSANSPFRSRTNTPSSSPPPTTTNALSTTTKNSESTSVVPTLVEPSSPLSATSPYFTTSEPKARFLTRYSQDMNHLNVVKDTKDLSQKKEELVSRLDRKLEVLRGEQLVVSEECRFNDELGENVESHVTKLARPHEAAKFRLHVEEVGKITSLLLGLSGRLARAENALMTMPDDHQERRILETKRDKLLDQLEEAKKLKESIDKRSLSVSNILYKYLNTEEYADYDHFINMKAKLIMDSKEIADKIKLGEEQLLALKETLIIHDAS